jgi:hypothetical protein
MTTVKRSLRVYADTSVFGGCFDDEFKTESDLFLKRFDRSSSSSLFPTSRSTSLEMAPDQVRGVLAGLPAEQVELVNTSTESDELRNAYLEARVVGPASTNDAAHIAVATTSSVDLVVSWNDKIRAEREKADSRFLNNTTCRSFPHEVELRGLAGGSFCGRAPAPHECWIQNRIQLAPERPNIPKERPDSRL